MGKGKHSNDTRGDQKGAQQHDEGQYGPKALEAKRAEIADHSGSRGQSERAIADPNRDGKSGEGLTALHEQEKNDPSMRDGRHRLFEERNRFVHTRLRRRTGSVGEDEDRRTDTLQQVIGA